MVGRLTSAMHTNLNPFQPQWFSIIGLIAIVGFIIHDVLRYQPPAVKRKVMIGLSLGLWALSTIFTFQRIYDPQFATFTFRQNLPLHFCTLITIFFTPAFIGTSQRWVRPLRALIFYPGLIAAFLAAVAPAGEYLDQPLLSWNTLFYFVHFGNVLLAILMVSLGFYTPTVKGLFGSLVSFFVLANIVFGITALLRAFVNPTANYFFSFEPEGSLIFEILWGYVTIPLVYQLPLLVLIIPVLLLQYGIYRGAQALALRAERRHHGHHAQNTRNGNTTGPRALGQRFNFRTHAGHFRAAH